MLRKIFGLLIFPILGASVHTYAQEEYDQQIFQYINPLPVSYTHLTLPTT